jgi:hypothetical protein
VALRVQVRHETVESIYVTDPNGYLIEVTRPLRAITAETISTPASASTR